MFLYTFFMNCIIQRYKSGKAMRKRRLEKYELMKNWKKYEDNAYVRRGNRETQRAKETRSRNTERRNTHIGRQRSQMDD